MDVRTLRIARTASLIVSTAFSSSAKFHSSLYSGQEEIMMDGSSSCRLQKISSVMNGIYGCSSFKDWIRTVFRVQSAAALVVSSSVPESRFYHLDVPVAELLPDEIVNLLEGDSQLVLIHILSNIFCQRVDLGEDPACQPSVRSESFTSATGAFSMFIMMKRDAFHTLFAKLRLASTRSQ